MPEWVVFTVMPINDQSDNTLMPKEKFINTFTNFAKMLQISKHLATILLKFT
jgi:hypothetical protein